MPDIVKTKSVRMIVVILLAVAALSGIGWYSYQFFQGLFYQSSPYAFPKKVILKKLSPNCKYLAVILYEEKTKNFFLAIEGRDHTQLIMNKTFVPSVSLHDPIVTLSWKDTEIVKIVVDHDFGEGNLVYEFNVRNLSFRQKGSN